MEGRDERQAGFISVYEEPGAQGDRGPAKQTEADCPSLGTAQGSVHGLLQSLSRRHHNGIEQICSDDNCPQKQKQKHPKLTGEDKSRIFRRPTPGLVFLGNQPL